MRIVNFLKYVKPYEIKGKFRCKEVASFEIELDIAQGSVLCRGWSVRQIKQRFFVVAPQTQDVAASKRGPLFLFKTPDSAAFADWVRKEMAKFGFTVLPPDPKKVIQAKSVADVLSKGKDALAEIQRLKDRAALRGPTTPRKEFGFNRR